MALLDLEKLRKDINILFGYVRCLMAKSDENCPLVATEWSPNHTNATGNPYTAGTYVFYNGHVYKCLFNNEGILPTNTTYWLDLGEGHLLAEEQNDWNATGGRRFILNKPTNTSDFTNDGEDGSSPYATMNDVSAAIPLPQDIDSVLGEGDTAPDKDINVQSIGLWDNFTAPFGFARITADKSRINFISKLGATMGHISQGAFNLLQGGFSFTINLPSLSSNRIATFQNASGVVAYLSDVSGGSFVATAWSADHSSALGNPYVIGTRVYYLGDIYEAIANNNGVVPTNPIYWNNLGPGKLLDQRRDVPYTGANGNVDLNVYGLAAEFLQINTTPTTYTPGIGKLGWNDTDGTLEFKLKGGNVTLQIGQEQVVRVVNKTATNITLLEANYQAVRITGVQGQRLKVDLAQASNDALSAETIGLVTETINNNQEGFITTSGLIRNINTTGSLQGETWADGDILYLSPTIAGGVTKVKPEAPDHLLIVGYVVYSHVNQGSIFVKVNNGYELDELHNVKITGTPANNNVLAFTSGTNIWENKTIDTVLGYVAANDSTFLYEKFMTNHFSYMLPGENSTYSLLRTNTTAGYLTIGTVATLSQMPMGISYSTGTVVGAVAGIYGAPMRIQLSNAQDFTFQRKWKVQLGNSAQRLFIGISNKYLSVAPVNADQSLFLNTLGVVKLDSSTNWHFIFNDGSGVAGLIDCGIDFPATNAYTYSLKIQKVKGATTLTMTLTRIDSSGNRLEVSQFVNSTDYNTGVDYNPAMWASNNVSGTNSQFYDYGAILIKSTI